jgi:predicted nicotinamide N-methyase
MTQRTISIQIPQNAAPGDTLNFCVGGNELELTVPPGSAPGDILEIQVGETTQDDDETEETITRVPLDDEKTLVLHHCPPTNEPSNDDDADGTHAMAWSAGLELVKFMSASSQEEHDHIQRVLELGSGLGVAGLALAAKSTICRRIVLTDRASAMPLLQYNVQQNQDLIPSTVTVETCAFNWQNDDDNASTTYDLILGSDLLYNPTMIPALVSTLKKLVSSLVWIAVRWRKPQLERRFFEETSHFIEWNLTGHSKCPLSWKEYGDPTSEASNQYFMQSMISIQGTLKPLAEISEEDTNSMTEPEYQQWELAQIQIYEGVKRENKQAPPEE